MLSFVYDFFHRSSKDCNKNMGILNLTDLIRKHAPGAVEEVSREYLNGQTVAVDAYIVIYQFLSTGVDIPGLMSGLFCRTCNLIDAGITPIFVFDGVAPPLKAETLAKRNETRTLKVSSSVVKEFQSLLKLMGVPFVNAAGEGEAQCAELVKQGKCDAVASEDMDTLPFGAPILLQKLKLGYNSRQTVTQIMLLKVLEGLGISHAEFVDLCILLGCDYIETINGIGQVKALQLIKKHKNIECIVRNIDPVRHPVSQRWMSRVNKVRDLFNRPHVAGVRSVRLRRSDPQRDGLFRLLCDTYQMEEDIFYQKLDALVDTFIPGRLSWLSLQGYLFKAISSWLSPPWLSLPGYPHSVSPMVLVIITVSTLFYWVVL